MVNERQAVKIVGIRIKCDAAPCDYQETITEIVASDVGKPCPQCGNNLLTDEDYIAAKGYLAAMQAMNDVFEIPADAPVDPNPLLVSVNPHAGDVTIRFSNKTAD